MKTTRWLPLLTAVALTPSAAWAQVPPFSADVVTTMNPKHAEQMRRHMEMLKKQGGKAPAMSGEMVGKLYASGLKIRVDMEANGRKTTMLSDMSPSGKNYMIMHTERMYAEMKHDANDARRSEHSRDLERYLKSGGDLCKAIAEEKQGATCQKLGSKELGGRICDEYETTSERGGKQRLCFDRKLHFPLRTETDAAVSEMRNIVEGAQPDSLFSIPDGYTKKELGSTVP